MLEEEAKWHTVAVWCGVSGSMAYLPHQTAQWLGADDIIDGLGYDPLVTLHACMERYITEGHTTEILEFNHFAANEMGMNGRIEWWREQLKLRDKEQEEGTS